MFTAILSRTWWSSLKKGEEGEKTETTNELSAETFDAGSSGVEEELLTASTIEDEFADDARKSAGEKVSPRSRSHRGLPPLPRGGQERDSAEREIETDDDEEGDVETHLGEDPLAPPFELDDIKPQRSSRGEDSRKANFKSRIDSAKEFFNTELLYRFDILESYAREKLAGSYRMEVKGNKGGIWTVNVGKDLEVVNRREEADVVLSLQHRDFIAIVNGDINPQLALLAQKMKYTGNIKSVVHFQSLLSPLAD